MYSKNVLNLEEACEYLGYKKSYLYKLTSAGIVPHSKPNGKKIFFDKAKLEAWMLSNPSTSLSDKKIMASTYVTTKSIKNVKP
jgi:excisionase family DNA binding protein